MPKINLDLKFLWQIFVPEFYGAEEDLKRDRERVSNQKNEFDILEKTVREVQEQWLRS